MARPSLAASFGRIGRNLADIYRELLPKAILGTPEEQQRTQRRLALEADEASLRLKAAAGKWIASDDLKISITKGGKRAATDISVKFGGANVSLLQRMAYESSRDLLTASDSTRPYLFQTIRRSQAISTTSKKYLPLGDNTVLEQAFNQSLTQGALKTEHGRQIAKRIMKASGLEKGDGVLLMSGRTWEAERYATLLARTRKAEAENLAYADELTQNGHMFIETSSHAGVSPGDICEFLQGKVWALVPNDLGIPEFPMEFGLPPWHPNCGHTFAVWIPELNGGDAAIAKWAARHDKDAAKLEEWRGPGGKLLAQQTLEPESSWAS